MIIAYDTETHSIRPGVQFPRVVCVSYAAIERGPYGEYVVGEPQIISEAEGLQYVRYWLDRGFTLIGAETAYDVGCPVTSAEALHGNGHALLEAFVAAYGGDRVHDIFIRQKLLDLAAGELGGRYNAKGEFVPYQYNLAALTRRLLKRDMSKGEDTWRLRYGELHGTPVSAWPADAREYALGDALATAEIWIVQEQMRKAHLPVLVAFGDGDPLADQYRQARAALWLKFMSAYGLRTRPDRVDAFATHVEAEYQRVGALLEGAGLAKREIKRRIQTGLYNRDTKAASSRMIQVCTELKLPVPHTKTGRVALDKASCEKTFDPLLQAYAELSSLSKTQSSDLPTLRRGAIEPIHSRFEVIQETGRTGSSGPNVQNIRRLEGIRECFVPRDGFCFIDSDYGKLELHTLAQTCLWLFGHSKLAEALNTGRDPHLEVAALIKGISYEEALRRFLAGDPEIENLRNSSKVANFGYPGGLGAKTLVSYAALSYGVQISEQTAAELKEYWRETWPEMREYADWISSCEGINGYNMVQPYSQRLRAGATYCAASNTPFQGLGADVAKLAGWRLFKACYVDRNDALYGSRTVNFPHDQFIIETPIQGAEAAADSVERHMNAAGLEILPDVPVKAKPLLCAHWSKHAKRVEKDGRLQIWGL